MKRILLVGEHYSENLGDGILCQCTDYLIKKYFKSEVLVEYLDLSGRKYFNKKPNQNNILLKWKNLQYFILEKIGLMNFYKSYRKKKKVNKLKSNVKNVDYDVIIIAGGQLIGGNFINKIERVFEFYPNVVKVFNSVGGNGSIISEKFFSEDRIKKNNIRGVTFRDSEINLSNIYCDKTFDTAILCNKVFSGGTKAQSEIVGLGIMKAQNFSEYQQLLFWKKLIKILKYNNKNFKLFTNGDPNDYDFAKKVLNDNNLNKKFLIDRPIYPHELIKDIIQFKSIVSFRMHSHVIAYSYGIPSIAVKWDQKIESFFKKNNYSERIIDICEKETVIYDKLIKAESEKNNLEQLKYQQQLLEFKFEKLMKSALDN